MWNCYTEFTVEMEDNLSGADQREAAKEINSLPGRIYTAPAPGWTKKNLKLTVEFMTSADSREVACLADRIGKVPHIKSVTTGPTLPL